MMLLADLLDTTFFDVRVIPAIIAVALAGIVVLVLKSGPGSAVVKASIACVLALACGVLATIALRPVFASDSQNKSAALPGEYLYLDSNRVNAVLGQISNGLSDSEKVSATETVKREVSGSASDVIKVGQTAEKTVSTEATVTPTATDRFYMLLGRLHGEFGSDFTAVDPTDPAEPFKSFLATVGSLQEGDFIEIRNARFEVPTYALPLPKIQYAARTQITRVIGDPASEHKEVTQKEVTRRALTRLITLHPKQVNRYLAPLGLDPRIPAVVFAQLRSDPKHHFTFFIPLSYAQIIDAPALLTGSVTIVGKIIRQLPAAKANTDTTKSASENEIEDFRDRDYYDVEAAATFTAALKQSTRTIRYTLHLPRGKVRPEDLIDPSVTIHPPGMVVLPIAIYK